MEIQVNTDNNIEGKQKLEKYMTEAISEGLSRFGDMITRVEVHVSDENGNKKGPKDKRCLLEARLKGMAPIAVTSHEDNIHNAVTSSIDKMKATLNKTMGKLKTH
jgi:ribosomal subunit interface protein